MGRPASCGTHGKRHGWPWWSVCRDAVAGCITRVQTRSVATEHAGESGARVLHSCWLRVDMVFPG